MSAPVITSVQPGSPAGAAGICVGDEIATIGGRVPSDVLEYRWLADEADPVVELRRGGLEMTVTVPKRAGEPLGAQVSSAVFDRVMTCDNHCEFCFIYQLPKGMRRSLYLKDDDYRLSFLYGNFTTLTRFTELDLERVLTEGLSPLHVSIHATDPGVRSEMLRNRRGGPSLRWLAVLLDAGMEVHGQVVVCPGVNDREVLAETLAGVLDRFSDMASLCVVPLGVSRYNTEARMRPHTPDEAAAVLETVHEAQEAALAALGRRLVFAADEYYLLAGETFPVAEHYEGFPMHEDGVGMARAFEADFLAGDGSLSAPRSGFFAAVDGAPPEGYRAPRQVAVQISRPRRGPVSILTGAYGARVIGPLLERSGHHDVEVIPVPSQHFGGTTAVTGLLTGTDLRAALTGRDPNRRYLLPDVCLSEGRFLDDTTPAELPVEVEVIPTDGASLRAALRR